jgi:hypothetical protein
MAAVSSAKASNIRVPLDGLVVATKPAISESSGEETSNTARDAVTDNFYRFVSTTGGNDALFNGLTAAVPFATVNGAIAGSQDDDVLLLRAGPYNTAVTGPWRITANRVLCSRGGTVRLTKSNP